MEKASTSQKEATGKLLRIIACQRLLRTNIPLETSVLSLAALSFGFGISNPTSAVSWPPGRCLWPLTDLRNRR